MVWFYVKVNATGCCGSSGGVGIFWCKFGGGAIVVSRDSLFLGRWPL